MIAFVALFFAGAALIIHAVFRVIFLLYRVLFGGEE